jgi:hypothetical protein
MGRPLLAEAELPHKLLAGQAHPVRKCISCENWIDAMELRFSVGCAVNPRTGKERKLAAGRVPRPKQVVVIGGPAGLEAARVSAERGHRVMVFERRRQLGGALRWTSVLHRKNEPFLRYLRDAISRSTAEVHVGRAVSADDVVALDPDVVVVATGGRIAVPSIPGATLRATCIPVPACVNRSVATLTQRIRRGSGSVPACCQDGVVLAGTPEPDTELFDTLLASMPDAEVHVASLCSTTPTSPPTSSPSPARRRYRRVHPTRSLISCAAQQVRQRCHQHRARSVH